MTLEFMNGVIAKSVTNDPRFCVVLKVSLVKVSVKNVSVIVVTSKFPSRVNSDEVPVCVVDVRGRNC